MPTDERCPQCGSEKPDKPRLNQWGGICTGQFHRSPALSVEEEKKSSVEVTSPSAPSGVTKDSVSAREPETDENVFVPKEGDQVRVDGNEHVWTVCGGECPEGLINLSRSGPSSDPDDPYPGIVLGVAHLDEVYLDSARQVDEDEVTVNWADGDSDLIEQVAALLDPLAFHERPEAPMAGRHREAARKTAAAVVPLVRADTLARALSEVDDWARAAKDSKKLRKVQAEQMGRPAPLMPLEDWQIEQAGRLRAALACIGTEGEK